jgi:hypothetical protein
MPHLEDAPRRAAMDPQRLVQHSVECGVVVSELPHSSCSPWASANAGGSPANPSTGAEWPAREDEAAPSKGGRPPAPVRLTR